MLSYIDEAGEQITIDSDLVWSKAIQQAIKIAYANKEAEVVIRVIVKSIGCCKKLIISYFQNTFNASSVGISLQGTQEVSLQD